MRVACTVCGASWPTDEPPTLCPVCATNVAAGANAGGSPAGPEQENERLLAAEQDQ